ncbi:UNVERIFIED_CONTAM: Asparagine--tRNA ligase, cytoplasmic 1 [Sesamum calycinum]|uniref:Asparagine--tRNA ligase, cytoplasmic 1 n=1 Tax=Sesamum calycinum TaxID=2727403 RepID=A0AAW2IT51_9LAMI
MPRHMLPTHSSRSMVSFMRKEQQATAKASKEEIVAAVGELTKAKENLSKLHERYKLVERCKLGGGIPKKDGKIDYAEDFFSRQAILTVSGLLGVETYACALVEAVKARKFENKVEWGIDLASEHERYLTKEKSKAPVIVYNYPKAIKACDAKVNEDNKTVAEMECLYLRWANLLAVAKEENYDVLKQS